MAAFFLFIAAAAFFWLARETSDPYITSLVFMCAAGFCLLMILEVLQILTSFRGGRRR